MLSQKAHPAYGFIWLEQGIGHTCTVQVHDVSSTHHVIPFPDHPLSSVSAHHLASLLDVAFFPATPRRFSDRTRSKLLHARLLGIRIRRAPSHYPFIRYDSRVSPRALLRLLLLTRPPPKQMQLLPHGRTSGNVMGGYSCAANVTVLLGRSPHSSPSRDAGRVNEAGLKAHALHSPFNSRQRSHTALAP